MSAALAEGMLAIVKAATEPLIAEIKVLRAEVAALKAAPPVPGPPGPAGAQGERGEKGDPGDRGVQGEKGEKGETGDRGETGATGAQGERGERGPAGESIIGEKGEKGDRGLDGVGLASAVLDRDGALVVTMTDGTTKSLGVVVGAKGESGQNGKDGLGFGDLAAVQVDDQTIEIRATKGDEVKVLGTFRFPVHIYRGVFKSGQDYRKGESVTWGGSLWVAKEDTSAKPEEHGTGSRAWQLAVKRGSPGERGLVGPPGPQGLKGEKGDRVAERW